MVKVVSASKKGVRRKTTFVRPQVVEVERKSAPTVEFSTADGLIEAYGSPSLQYNLLDANFKGIHAPFRCKDYFQDLFFSEFMEKPVSIYGFSWKPSKAPWAIKDEVLRIAVRYKQIVLKRRIPAAKEFLDQFTTPLGFKPISVYADKTGKIVVFEFNREWITKPVYVSLLTLLMRLSLAYKSGEDTKKFFDRIIAKPDDIGKYDGGYVSQSRAVLEHILGGNKWEPKQDYKQYFNATSTLHNNSGIATFGPSTIPKTIKTVKQNALS